jgi:hypothetical protein
MSNPRQKNPRPPFTWRGMRSDATYNIYVNIAFIYYNSMHSNMKYLYFVHEDIAKNKLGKKPLFLSM